MTPQRYLSEGWPITRGPLVSETRTCWCERHMTVSIHHGEPTWRDLDDRFTTLGWRGSFCPDHANTSA